MRRIVAVTFMVVWPMVFAACESAPKQNSGAKPAAASQQPALPPPPPPPPPTDEAPIKIRNGSMTIKNMNEWEPGTTADHKNNAEHWADKKENGETGKKMLYVKVLYAAGSATSACDGRADEITIHHVDGTSVDFSRNGNKTRVTPKDKLAATGGTSTLEYKNPSGGYITKVTAGSTICTIGSKNDLEVVCLAGKDGTTCSK